MLIWPGGSRASSRSAMGRLSMRQGTRELAAAALIEAHPLIRGLFDTGRVRVSMVQRARGEHNVSIRSALNVSNFKGQVHLVVYTLQGEETPCRITLCPNE